LEVVLVNDDVAVSVSWLELDGAGELDSWADLDIETVVEGDKDSRAEFEPEPVYELVKHAENVNDAVDVG